MRKMNTGFHGLFLILLAPGVLSQQDIQAVEKVANSNNALTSALHMVLRKNDKEGNLLFSPFSLSAAMAMVKAGAKGSTATEIQRGMRYPADDNVLFEGFRSLLSTLKSNENFTLETANRVYAQNGFSLNPEYNKTLNTYFGAEAQQVNFAESAAAARKINGWVEDVTRNKIKDLFPSDSFDSMTRLVLVNAIYFKGLWANEFDPEFTRKAQFYVSPSENVTVDMMQSENDYPFVDLTKELDARAVALPYKGDRLSMVIVLPNKPDGLAALEKKLENYNLAEIRSKMRNSKVSLSLPRFRLESTIDLAGILSDMGMESMFQDTTADFSGIPAPENPVPLKLSKAIQKTFLEVNEEGSEAAAATGFEAGVKSGFWIPEMKAEHPFIAYIMDDSTSSVLFVTSVVKPTNEAVSAARSALVVPKGSEAAGFDTPASSISSIAILLISSFDFILHILLAFL